jgi:ABC-type uncharacterized transport system ATPase subunit
VISERPRFRPGAARGGGSIRAASRGFGASVRDRRGVGLVTRARPCHQHADLLRARVANALGRGQMAVRDHREPIADLDQLVELLRNDEHGLIRTRRVVAFARQTIAAFGVKARGPSAIARSLSGGNLQKFIVGREIGQQPKVLIAAQPTWGVDVGASAQIRQALLDLRERGVAILVVSEELDELIEICDRLAVIAHGQLSPAKRVGDTSREEIGVLMAGSSARDEADAALITQRRADATTGDANECAAARSAGAKTRAFGDHR